MWKILKFFGFLAKAVFWLALVFALAGLALLYILEHNMPAPLVQRLAAAASSDSHLVRIGRATYSLKSGLHLHQVKVFPKRVAVNALASADEIAVDLSLQPRLALRQRVRGVTVSNLLVPALPPKGKGADREKPPPKPDPVIPDLPPFALTLDSPDVLGVRASRLTATVDLADKRVDVGDVAIQWPDKAFAMSVAGDVSVDLTTRLVKGQVKGQAFPANILPLLAALRAKGAIRQIDCFSKIERPVNAGARFDVNIDNSDFSLLLDLDVGPCAYRGVPMKYAKGTLGAYGTNIYTTVVIGPLQAESATGPLSGRLVYSEETEGLELDATASMDMTQLVSVINVLNHGELDPLRCDTPPRVSIRGVVALSSAKSTVSNDFSGTIAFDEGSIFKVRAKDVSGDFSVKGYTASFTNIAGASPDGGKISGTLDFVFPNYAATSTLFSTRIALADVELSELSRAFNITNERAGAVSGFLRLGGSTRKHAFATFNGEGSIRIRDGLLNRMRLFAGFTDYLARNIPGVSALVNQSTGSMDFTIRDGILSTDSLLIEGDVFSIQGRGTCNFTNEALDGVVRANIFKKKTIAGRITHLVTFPFTRLLLEFKIFGTFNKPEWSYANIIERITESFSESSPAPAPEPQPQP